MKKLFLALTLCLVASPVFADTNADFEKALSKSARYANEFLTYTPYSTTEMADEAVVLTPSKLYEYIVELQSKVAELKRDVARQDEQISKLLKVALKNNVRVQELEKK